MSRTLVSFDANDQMTPEFLSLNPNNKIPAILDPNGPGGKPLPLFESGAILIYLADKTGQLMPQDAAGRYQTIQWLMFQMGGIGPMFGQVGFFNKFAGKDYADKRPRERYVDEVEAPARRAEPATGASRPGSWAMNSPLRTWPPFPGSTISSASMRPANWWGLRTFRTSRARSNHSWRVRR